MLKIHIYAPNVGSDSLSYKGVIVEGIVDFSYSRSVDDDFSSTIKITRRAYYNAPYKLGAFRCFIVVEHNGYTYPGFLKSVTTSDDDVFVLEVGGLYSYLDNVYMLPGERVRKVEDKFYDRDYDESFVVMSTSAPGILYNILRRLKKQLEGDFGIGVDTSFLNIDNLNIKGLRPYYYAYSISEGHKMGALMRDIVNSSVERFPRCRVVSQGVVNAKFFFSFKIEGFKKYSTTTDTKRFVNFSLSTTYKNERAKFLVHKLGKKYQLSIYPNDDFAYSTTQRDDRDNDEVDALIFDVEHLDYLGDIGDIASIDNKEYDIVRFSFDYSRGTYRYTISKKKGVKRFNNSVDYRMEKIDESLDFSNESTGYFRVA